MSNNDTEVVNGVAVDHSHDRVFFNTFSLVLGVLVLITVVISAIANTIDPDEKENPERTRAVAERIAPVGAVYTDAAAVATAKPAAPAATEVAAARGASDIVNGVCSGCHMAGVLGAIKLDDTAGWQARLDEAGLDMLVSNAINGKNSMPQRGGDASLSDDDIRRSVVYMLENAGVSVP